MPLDLTGLGLAAGGAMQGWNAEEQYRLKLAEQQRQQQAIALFAQGITNGQSQGQPNPTFTPPPQPSSQLLGQNGPAPGPAPMNPPMPGAGVGAQPPSSPVGPPPPPMPQMQPQPQAQASPTMQPPMGQGQPGGLPPVSLSPQFPNLEQRLQVFANNVKRANPNVDPQTLGEAIMMYAKIAQADNSQDTKFLGLMMQQQGLNDRAMNALQERYAGLQAAQQRVDTQQAGAGQRSNAAILAAQQRLNAGAASIDDNTATIAAQALHAGDTSPAQMLLGFSKNRPAIMSQIFKKVQELYPGTTGEELAGWQAAFGGMKAGANVVGRTASSVAIGAEEIPRLMPYAIQASKALDLSQFPTVNSITNAYEKGTGDTNIVALNSYIQTLKNAYQQISARGGRISDKVRDQGDALMSGNMPTSQLIAAGQAMMTEGGVVKQAAGAAMQDVTGAPAPQGGGAGGPQPGTVENGYRFKGGDPSKQENWEQVK